MYKIHNIYTVIVVEEDFTIYSYNIQYTFTELDILKVIVYCPESFLAYIAHRR